MGGNRVQGVADGVLASDAVNLGQLNKVERLANRQGAIAAAAVNIPVSAGIRVGETTVGVGLGFSGGESAIAVGLASRVKDNVLVKGSVGTSGGGTTAGGVGVSITFGGD